MRSFILVLFTFTTWFSCVAQNDAVHSMIKLAKTYHEYMFRNVPPTDVLNELKQPATEEMKFPQYFIRECITSHNHLTDARFLTRPANEDLKRIYIIHTLSNLAVNRIKVSDEVLLDSLMQAIIPEYEMLDHYYGMLFTAVGNKNQPFNLSKLNLNLKSYELKDETEQAILFLRCMAQCNATIWGYMNIVTPPNTEKAYGIIKKFPKYNGRPYYQFNEVYFGDFDMVIVEDKPKQSYKNYYLDKYFELLLAHLICLNREKASDQKVNDLLLGSILKEKDLYHFSKYKGTLEKIFKTKRTTEEQ